MQLSRFRALFPWRIALLLGLASGYSIAHLRGVVPVGTSTA